ncbi:hypothetical protein CLOM_g164 [Closterium sp. NIES-68]|nr:hypothetical protein CLOM_g164 [Closterium sp. NIES-68]
MSLPRSALHLARQTRLARKHVVSLASAADISAVTAPLTESVIRTTDAATQSNRHVATLHGPNPQHESNRRASTDASREKRNSTFEASRRKVALWGNGDHGRLGLGGEGDRSGDADADGDGDGDGGSVNVPRVCAALEDKDVCQVACGGAHTLVLTADGRVFTMGLNDKGQLGVGDSNAPPYVTSPKEVVGFDRPVVAVAAAAFHSAAIDDAGQMYLWGGNAASQVGLGSRGPSKVHSPRVPEALRGVSIQHMALGGQHTLAVTADGQLLSWGKGSLGHGPLPLFSRLSRKSSETIPRLVHAMANTKVVRVAAGMLHSACVDDSGRLFVFGGNRFAQLGLGDHKDREEPVEVASLQHAVTDVSCGGYHTAAVTGPGHLFTWGANEYGCLGHGPRHSPPSAVPVKVAGRLAGKRVVQVSCGWKHTAAVACGADAGEEQSLCAAAVGRLYTWGWGGSQGSHAIESRSTGGQLGLGNEFEFFEPMWVSGGAFDGNLGKFSEEAMLNVRQVSCGFNHTAAIIS